MTLDFKFYSGAVATAMFLSYNSGSNINELVDVETAVYTFGAPSVCLEERPSLSEDNVHHICYQLDLVVCLYVLLHFLARVFIMFIICFVSHVL